MYKRVFVTPDGQYEFLRATLVRGLKKVLEELSGAGSYIDEIVVYNDSRKEHLRTLKELFGRLRSATITDRPTKGLLGANRMEFLGYQIGGYVITLSGDNLEKVQKTPPATTKKQVRSVLGLWATMETTCQPSPIPQRCCPTSSKKGRQNKYNGMRHRRVLTHCSGVPATRTSTESS